MLLVRDILLGDPVSKPS